MTASEKTIEDLAYALWEARGRPSGSADVDWLAAEKEVKGRQAPPVAIESSAPKTTAKGTSPV